jgi:hypothetical protein
MNCGFDVTNGGIGALIIYYCMGKHSVNTVTIAITSMKPFFCTTLLLVCFVAIASAQTTVPVKIKPCLFNGKWQLVQTFSEGKLHGVKKSDYDGVICFRSSHR